MCLQCCAEAVFVGDLMPGWALMRSTKDHEDWPIGQFGLIQINNPAFVFPGPLVRNPPDGAPPPEVARFYDAIHALEDVLVTDPVTGWELVEAARGVGYDRSRDGRFAVWLMTRLCLVTPTDTV